MYTFLCTQEVFFPHQGAKYMITQSKTLADRIRFFIKEKGLKLAYVASNSEISLSHLNKILAGDNRPSLDVIRALEKTLDVEIQDLLGEDVKDLEPRLGELSLSEFEIFYRKIRAEIYNEKLQELLEVASKLSTDNVESLIEVADTLLKKEKKDKRNKNALDR